MIKEGHHLYSNSRPRMYLATQGGNDREIGKTGTIQICITIVSIANYVCFVYVVVCFELTTNEPVPLPNMYIQYSCSEIAIPWNQHTQVWDDG